MSSVTVVHPAKAVGWNEIMRCLLAGTLTSREGFGGLEPPVRSDAANHQITLALVITITIINLLLLLLLLTTTTIIIITLPLFVPFNRPIFKSKGAFTLRTSHVPARPTSYAV